MYDECCREAIPHARPHDLVTRDEEKQVTGLKFRDTARDPYLVFLRVTCAPLAQHPIDGVVLITAED